MLRNASSNGQRGRLVAMTVSAIFNQGSKTTFVTENNVCDRKQRFSAPDKNLGSQNYSENHIEFDNVIYALELGARKVRRFGR